MPHLWLPNILESHRPCCGGALVTCWHVILKEVQNSSVGFLHPIVNPALPFVNIPLLPTPFNDSQFLRSHSFEEYARVIVALRKLVSIQSSVCPCLINSTELQHFREVQVTMSCHFGLSDKAISRTRQILTAICLCDNKVQGLGCIFPDAKDPSTSATLSVTMPPLLLTISPIVTKMSTQFIFPRFLQATGILERNVLKTAVNITWTTTICSHLPDMLLALALAAFNIFERNC